MERILVVDDDVLCRSMVVEFVSGNYVAEVTEASGYDEAIKEIDSIGGEIILAITDINLGKGQTGFELYYYCKVKYPKIVFILISGNPTSIMTAQTLGIENVLQKGEFNLSDLGEMIKKVLGR